MSEPTAAQLRLCKGHGVPPTPPKAGTKVGAATNLRTGWPLNGLRHPPIGDTNGWYLWVGEEPGTEDDFFAPLHVEHLADWRPEVIDYLALPPGWRFLIAPGQEEVWFDETLLNVTD